MSGYPKAMVHPAYRAGVATPVMAVNPRTGHEFVHHHQGSPDRYPPVTVHNPDEEGMHRAMGYLEHGEAPKMTPYSEYPLMLSHPGHVPAVQPETHAKRDENGATLTWTTPGSEAKFPPVSVASIEEEERWTAKGYRRPGKADPDAVQAAISSPHVPGRVAQEWPKMVDGVTVQEPGTDRSGFQRYPMWVGPTLVHNEDEEQAARGGENVAATAELVRTEPGPVAPDPALAAALAEIAALKTQLAAKDAPDPAVAKRAAARDRMAKVRAARKPHPQPEAAD